MTIRDIAIAFGYEVDKSSESKVNASINGLKNTATKLLGAIGVGLSLAGVQSFVNDCKEEASTVEEMQNKFDVVFQGMTDEVEAWSATFAKSIGRNKNVIKGYLADNQNLLVGMGASRDAAADLSENMISLALDLASFNNIDEKSAVDAMSKSLMGQTESAKSLGAVLNDNTRAAAMNALSLAGNFNALSELQKMQVNYQAILMQSTDAVGDCVRSMDSYRASEEQHKAVVQEVKELIGSYVLPLFARLNKARTEGLYKLEAIIKKAGDFTEKVGGLGRVLATLGGIAAAVFVFLNFGKIQKGLSIVLTLIKKISLHTVAMVAVIIVIALLVEDFISFMQGKDSVIGTMFEKAGINADAVRQKIMTAFNKLKDFLSVTFESIKQIISTVFGWIKGYWDRWGDTILAVFGKVLNRIIAILSDLIDFVTAVLTWDWKGAWEAAKDILRNILGAIWDIVSTIFMAIVNYIRGKIPAIKEAIVNGFIAAINWIKTLPSKALQWGADFVQGLINGIKSKISGVVNAVKGVGNKIKSFLHFSRPDTGPLADYEGWMPDFMAGLASGIRNGKGVVVGALRDLTGDMQLFSEGNLVTGKTRGMAAGTSNSTRTVTQINNFSNQFNGDTAGQKKSSKAMETAGNDATSQLARALAFAK